MKRITNRDRYGKAILTDWGSVEDMVEKLADYEDLGLEPAEISEMMNSTAQLLSERGRSDKFLPGQTVYAIERDEWGDACDVNCFETYEEADAAMLLECGNVHEKT